MRDAPRLLEGRARAVVDDGDGPLELRADLLGPFFTTAAAGIAVDENRRSGARRGCHEHGGERRDHLLLQRSRLPVITILIEGACHARAARPATR